MAFLSHFLAVSLRSYSSWTSNLLSRFSFLTNEIKSSSNMAWCTHPLMYLLIMQEPSIICRQAGVYIMMLPPLCFTVAVTVYLRTYTSLFSFRHDKLNDCPWVLFFCVLISLTVFRHTALCCSLKFAVKLLSRCPATLCNWLQFSLLHFLFYHHSKSIPVQGWLVMSLWNFHLCTNELW